MSAQKLTNKKIADIFGVTPSSLDLLNLESKGLIPPSSKFRSGALKQDGWDLNDLPAIGEKIGFFKKLETPTAISVFTTKGGVLKSTLALNLARTAALHNIKTCVVGLDIQGDISSNLGHEIDIDPSQPLEEVIAKINQTRGLADLFNGQMRINELVCSTDLDNLFLIPETPELVALNDSLNNVNRREYWLKEKVIDLLKKEYDLIIMDCSPNWNKLTTNALVACDALISPLECKINNFRNFKVFRHFLAEFKHDMQIDFETVFVPTRYSSNKKLSIEILEWYRANIPGCTRNGIKECIVGEEATALNKCMIEHAPTNKATIEMRSLLKEINERLQLIPNFEAIPPLHTIDRSNPQGREAWH